jgi:hypothetical protein
MNLKWFHVLFITVSVVMAVGVGIWALGAWWQNREIGFLFLALLAFAGAAGLVAYARRFLEKISRIRLD